MYYKKIIVALLVVFSSFNTVFADEEVIEASQEQVAEMLCEKCKNRLAENLNQIKEAKSLDCLEKLPVIVFATVISQDGYGTHIGFYDDGSIVTYLQSVDLLQVVYLGPTPMSSSTVWELVRVNGVNYVKHYHVGYNVYTNGYSQYVYFY